MGNKMNKVEGIFYKERFEQPDLFIFAQSEDDSEGLVRFLEQLQELTVGNSYKPSTLINAPNVPRNKLHHAMKCEEQLVRTESWPNYSQQIEHCVFIKDHRKLCPKKVFQLIHKKIEHKGRKVEIVFRSDPQLVKSSLGNSRVQIGT